MLITWPSQGTLMAVYMTIFSALRKHSAWRYWWISQMNTGSSSMALVTKVYRIRQVEYNIESLDIQINSKHYNDIIMGAMASQIISLTIVYSVVYSDADQRKHESSASLAFVRGIHRGPVNSPHKWPVTRKMFPFDDVTMGNMKCAFEKLPKVVSDCFEHMLVCFFDHHTNVLLRLKSPNFVITIILNYILIHYGSFKSHSCLTDTTLDS